MLVYFQNQKGNQNYLMIISFLTQFFFENEKDSEWEKFCNEETKFYELVNPELNSKNACSAIKVIFFITFKLFIFLRGK